MCGLAAASQYFIRKEVNEAVWDTDSSEREKQWTRELTKTFAMTQYSDNHTAYPSKPPVSKSK